MLKMQVRRKEVFYMMFPTITIGNKDFQMDKFVRKTDNFNEKSVTITETCLNQMEEDGTDVSIRFLTK